MATTIETDVVVIGAGITSAMFVERLAETTDAAITPMPQGSTGVWHVVNTLGTARSNHAVAAAQDPMDPTRWFLYAAGGNDGTNVLDSMTRGASSPHQAVRA